MASQTSPSDEDVVEVVVTSWKGECVGDAPTVGKFLTPMIDGASAAYTKLYKVECGASVRIDFKFARKPSESKGDGKEKNGEEEVMAAQSKDGNTLLADSIGDGDEQKRGEEAAATELETITMFCKNEHPYLNQTVWAKTRGGIESTFLKGESNFLCMPATSAGDKILAEHLALSIVHSLQLYQ
jgi:hypothetical protein